MGQGLAAVFANMRSDVCTFVYHGQVAGGAAQNLLEAKSVEA